MPGPRDGALQLGDFLLRRVQPLLDRLGAEACLLDADEVEII